MSSLIARPRASRRRRFALLTMSAAAAAVPLPALAANRYWVGASYYWDAGGSWSLTAGGATGAGQPANGDSAFIESPLNLTVIRDPFSPAYTSPGPALIQLSNTGTNQTRLWLHPSAGALFATAEIVGQSGRGLVDHEGGSNTVTNLTLASTPAAGGTYNLSGAAAVLAVGNVEAVGDQGTGVFAQTAGSHTVAQDLLVGNTSSGNGTFTLSGNGTLNVVFSEYVGNQGKGAFTQTGGANTAGSLYVGYAAAGTGSYTLGGGSASAGVEYVGNFGVGTFTQTGGVNSAGSLSVGKMTPGRGTYTLNGGTLTAGTELLGEVGTGTFIQAGGTHTAGKLDLGYLASGNGSYTLTGGSLAVAGFETVGLQGTGAVTQTGGTHTVAGSLSMGGLDVGKGSYALSGAGSLAVDGVEYVGHLGNGSFAQTGGTHAVGGLVVAYAPTTNGTFALSGDGSLTVSTTEDIGTRGTATFTQTGGTHTVGALYLAVSGGRGTYSLSAGSLAVAGSEYIGSLGTGAFNQSGGTHAVGTTLAIAATGSFNFSGGSLTVGAISRAPGGVFDWTAGSLAVTNSPLPVGYAGPLGSAVTLNSARTLTVNQTVTIDAGASLTLDAGTFAVGALVNNGAFAFNSGTLRFLNGFTLGAGGPLGSSYALGTGKSLVAFTLSVDPGAVLYVPGGGAVTGQAGVTNNGEIRLDGALASLNSFAGVSNAGLLSGNGRINAPAVINSAGGELRAGAGERLLVNAGSATNAGRINLLGGAVEFAAPLNNTGTIAGRGTLITAGLANSGTLTASAGFTDVFGAVNNGATGKVIVTGGGTATFYNAVTGVAGAEIRVSTNSAAVFLAPVNGPINFTGTGAKYFEAGVSAAGAIAAGGATVVQAGAALSADYVRESSLTVNGRVTLNAHSPASTVNALAVDAGGTLDLTDNALIVDYAAGSSPAATIRALIASGRAGGSWTGSGITSSAAAADSGKAVGYAEASDALGPAGGTFAGVPVDGSAVLIRYTFSGDADLDGHVGFADLVAVAQHYDTVGGGTWSTGDFDYDGNVGFSDLVAVAQNYDRSLPAAAEIPGATAGFAADWAAAVAAVPEPAGALFVGAGIVLTVRRRRRPARALI